MARILRSTLDPWELAVLAAGVCACCSQPLLGARGVLLCRPCQGTVDDLAPRAAARP